MILNRLPQLPQKGALMMWTLPTLFRRFGSPSFRAGPNKSGYVSYLYYSRATYVVILIVALMLCERYFYDLVL